MDTIPTDKAELELAELIHRAAQGETIVLEAPSGEQAELKPVVPKRTDRVPGTAAPERVPGLLKDKFDIPARLFEPMSDEELKLWYGDDA